MVSITPPFLSPEAPVLPTLRCTVTCTCEVCIFVPVTDINAGADVKSRLLLPMEDKSIICRITLLSETNPDLIVFVNVQLPVSVSGAGDVSGKNL